MTMKTRIASGLAALFLAAQFAAVSPAAASTGSEAAQLKPGSLPGTFLVETRVLPVVGEPTAMACTRDGQIIYQSYVLLQAPEAVDKPTPETLAHVREIISAAWQKAIRHVDSGTIYKALVAAQRKEQNTLSEQEARALDQLGRTLSFGIAAEVYEQTDGQVIAYPGEATMPKPRVVHAENPGYCPG